MLWPSSCYLLEWYLLGVKLSLGHAGFNPNRPFYSYAWNRGWGWPCFDTNLPALSCKSSYSYANQYFSRTISITKKRRFVSKQGHRQPHIHSKARVLSPQLKNGLLPEEPLGPLYMSVTSLLRSPTRNWVFLRDQVRYPQDRSFSTAKHCP